MILAILLCCLFMNTVSACQIGTVSYYGNGFDGHRMANGQIFHKYEMTIASNTLKLNSYHWVCTRYKCIRVKVTDRGAFDKYGRIADLSEGCAIRLGFKYKGLTKVRIE